MKALFTLLLLVNLALAAYTLLAPRQAAVDAPAAGPDQRGPDPGDSPAACSAGAAGRVHAVGQLRRGRAGGRAPGAGGALGERATETSVPVVAGWWVYIPPLRIVRQSMPPYAACRRLASTTLLVDAEGPTRNAISLGIFKSEESALAFLLTVQARVCARHALGRASIA